jgi:hypothetical protein
MSASWSPEGALVGASVEAETEVCVGCEVFMGCGLALAGAGGGVSRGAPPAQADSSRAESSRIVVTGRWVVVNVVGSIMRKLCFS